jgi:DNA-binding NarL/FixJ family response regulator
MGSMDEVLRLVIVEDPLMQLQGPLESEGFSIAASAPRGCDLLTLVERHRPDAVLLDLDLSELNGTTAIQRLVERFPDIPAIVLGDSVLPAVIMTVFKAGARAYIVKTAELDPIADAVRLAVEMGYPKAVLDSSHSTRSGDPVRIPNVERRRLIDRRAATGRRTGAATTPILERRSGVDRRLAERRR